MSDSTDPEPSRRLAWAPPLPVDGAAGCPLCRAAANASFEPLPLDPARVDVDLRHLRPAMDMAAVASEVIALAPAQEETVTR